MRVGTCNMMKSERSGEDLEVEVNLLTALRLEHSQPDQNIRQDLPRRVLV